MARRKRGKGKRDDESRSLPTKDVPLGEGAESEVPLEGDPPKPSRRRKIHKRRKVPSVRKGKAVEDPDPTPPADIDED